MTTPAQSQHITQLLEHLGDGHPSTADELLPLVYDELRALAGHFFRSQRTDHTLQPTALVHDAYAKMVAHGGETPTPERWNSRSHFFAVAAKAMRQILSNHARDRRAEKRGGQWHRVTLSQAVTPTGERDLDLHGWNSSRRSATPWNTRTSAASFIVI